MQPPAPSSNHDAVKGLPPVTPPSASHIVKLFVVPLSIVLGLFAVAYLFLNVTGSSVLKTPEAFLDKLRSNNPDVRKRAASDLAQVLLRDDRLASEPAFALDLAGELRKAIEQADEEPTPGTADSPLTGSENYLLYVLACVSNLASPVGVPQLKQMALEGGDGAPEAQLVRRWRALWALAKLGDSLKRFDKLPAERRQAVLGGFERESAGDGERAATAAAALAYLQGREAGRPSALGVDEVLTRAAEDKNPFLREIAVFAMNFWEGDAAASARMEQALLARLEDRGEGEDLLAQLSEKNAEHDPTFTRDPGAKIRYNAAVALAQRGSDRTPFALLKEMLDESEQQEQHRVRRRKDGREIADQATAQQTVLTALRAVAELHRKNARINLTDLVASVDKVKTSADPAVRAEAERTRQALESTP